jgi:predicted RNA methylase
MKFITIEKAAKLLNLTNGQIIDLLTKDIIKNGQIIDEEIYIPCNSIEYLNKNKHLLFNINELFDITALSNAIHITTDTAMLWVKLKKIIPDRCYKNRYFFYRDNILKVMKELNNQENSRLKSRRNKTYKEGIDLYSSYLPRFSYNDLGIKKIFDILNNEYHLVPNHQQVNLIVAECALQLLNQSLGMCFSRAKDLLGLYITGKINLGEYNILLDSLIINKSASLEFINTYPLLFNINYIFVENEDLLGYLYLSVSNISDRKKSGIYYTPCRVVNKLIMNLAESGMIDENIRYLDPCCGTGNFILNLPDIIPWQKIWATDLDKNAIYLCRINMLLKFPSMPLNELLGRIRCADYLMNDFRNINAIDADGPLVILGNPPWGVNYSLNEKLQLSRMFECASPMNVESFALFIEKSIRLMRTGDYLSFVIPETLLRVYSHLPIRRLLNEMCSIKGCMVLGEQFSNVNCPSIIFTVQREPLNENTSKLRCSGAVIYPGISKSFTIRNNRPFDNEFDILLDETQYRLLNKLMSTDNCTTLAGNADWALGIVTGNNNKFLEKEKNKNNEIILKGLNINKFKINYKNINYIKYNRELFQQKAPDELYRAPEKLFYKFINKNLIFAYDNKKTLSLNSANILIPKFNNLNIKYILAVLNSDIANFIYHKKFKAVKVLRSQLEVIPIKIINADEQQYFINMADKIINNNLSDKEINNIILQINERLNSLYDLSEDEIEILKQ